MAPRNQFCYSDIVPKGYNSKDTCIMFMDTEREKQIKLGTDYPFDALGAGECILPNSYTAYGLKVGDTVNL